MNLKYKRRCWALLLALAVVTLLGANRAAAADDREAADDEVMACEDESTGKVSYRAAADTRGDKRCHKLSASSGTFNQVKDFAGYRASLVAESAEAVEKPRRRKGGKNDASSSEADDDQRGQTALTSFDFDELQSKKDAKRFQCHVNGETKVNKGCRVEIELIRGALTTISFSRLGRSNANVVKWKRVLDGECRDLTVRAVVSGCE